MIDISADDAARFDMERPASPDKIAQLTQKYQQLQYEITAVISLIDSGNYTVAIGVSDFKAVTNVFSLIREVNLYTLSVIEQLLGMLEMDAVRNDGAKLSEMTVDSLLAHPLASLTPDILHPDFCENQHDADFFPASLQQEPSLKQTALEIGLRYLHRPEHLSEEVMPTSVLYELLMQVSNHDALRDLTSTVENYIATYINAGYTDLNRLKMLTDLMQDAFTEMTGIMSKVMRASSRDLFNNIYSLQAGVLCLVGEEFDVMSDHTAEVYRVAQES